MENVYISVAIPFYNNFDFINECLNYILKDNRINEIVIVDDKSLQGELMYLESIIKKYSKIRLYKNENNIGVFANKLKAISLCKNDWVILCDSDNIMEKIYVDKIYEQYPWDKKIIYAPEWAKTFPGKTSPFLNYSFFKNKLIDKKFVLKYKNDINFICLLNTCNYFVNKNELLNSVPTSEFNRNEMSCIDTLFINKSWLKENNYIKIVEGMIYKHRLHPNSNYNLKNKSKEAFYRNKFFRELE